MKSTLSLDLQFKEDINMNDVMEKVAQFIIKEEESFEGVLITNYEHSFEYN